MPLPNISLTGNVVDDPELRFTSGGKAVVSFRVAANQRKKTENGGWVDGDSCFLTVSAWEQAAEAIAEQLQRGTKVIVTGVLKQRDWEDKDGNKRTAYDVQAYDVALVVRRPKADREKPSQPASNDPWSQSAGQADPWATSAPTTEPPF
jgi:single-strand DNA-binding protein